MCPWEYFSKCGAPRGQGGYKETLGGTEQVKDSTDENIPLVSTV